MVEYHTQPGPQSYNFQNISKSNPSLTGLFLSSLSESLQPVFVDCVMTDPQLWYDQEVARPGIWAFFLKVYPITQDN